MIQFTSEEVEKLREKSSAYPLTIEKLKHEVEEVFQGEIIVPKTGIANWILYYYCPDCSIQLEYRRNSPKGHSCPHCGRVLTGEPYDSAWWGMTNSRNYNAVFGMAIIWLATGDEAYAKKAIEILKTYAMYYPDYEIHGNIPYNGPGRSGAQTLDEANFQRSFAMAYDILSSCMTEEERTYIRDRMFLPGAEFLLEYRHRQLHNHEVIINSAIAVIGILFDRTDLVEAALYEDYGIVYQLEHGMQPNHMWFEGSFGYHFYALTSFFAFEKFALHTKYSNIHHKNYRDMMEFLCDYMEPDYGIPMLNDTNYGHLNHLKELYEFAYREIGGKKLAFVLNTYYKEESRDNLEAFLYGADTIEQDLLPLKNFHTTFDSSGHTILRGPEGRYLLLKHDRYGGEHDHYDRLGISYLAYGKPVSRDLGTTGYGAKMHYDFYKNTASHNTLMIGEENQAPVNGELTRYEEKDGVIYVEAEADWTKPYEMPDSFTIVQWSEENYRTVRMKRKIAWTDCYFVEVFLADGIPEGKPADWMMHISGTPVSEAPEISEGTENSSGQKQVENAFTGKPLTYLHDIQEETVETKGTYQKTYESGGVFTTIYGLSNGQTIFTAMGPDNPSSGEIAYLMERRFGSSMICAHVVESWKEAPMVQDVEFKNEEVETGKVQICVTVTEQDGETRKFRL